MELLRLLNAIPLRVNIFVAAPLLVVIGVAAAIAETLSIGLAIVFLLLMLGTSLEVSAITSFSSIMSTIKEISSGNSTAIATAAFALLVFKAMLITAYNLLDASVRHKINHHVRRAIFDRCFRLPFEQFQLHHKGTLINVLITDSFSVGETMHSITRLVISMCAILILGGMVVAISWEMAAIVLFGSCCLVWGLRSLAEPISRIGEQGIGVNKTFADRSMAVLHAMRTIRLYGLDDVESTRFDLTSSQIKTVHLRLDRIFIVSSPLNELGYLGILACIVAVSPYLEVSGAAIVTALAFLYRLQPHVREVEASLIKLASLKAPLAEVVKFLNGPVQEKRDDGEVVFSKLNSGITFDRVSFRFHPGEYSAIQNVSFFVRAGAITAIVGPSGAGKTTLINLLMGLYQPTGGQIFLDHTGLNNFNKRSWLRRAAVAGQDVELLDGSIYENIAFANPSASPENVVRVAELAAISEFISSLPAGYETRVGDRGIRLSAGQRQRVGVARALLLSPEVLILDEATSGLDSALENQVFRNVCDLMTGRTLIIITHRTTTLELVDDIIVLEDGAVSRASGDELRDGRAVRGHSGERN